MGDVVYVNEDGKAESFWEATKRKAKKKLDSAKEKMNQTVEFCKQNKETVIAVGTFAVPAVVELAKLSFSKRNKRDEDECRKKRMWDPVEGHWWKLKRELTSTEFLEVEQRVRNGEARGEVLADMGVLK